MRPARAALPTEIDPPSWKKTTLAVVLVAAIHTAAAAADWNLFRGDPLLQGRAQALPDGLEPLWLFEVGEGIESGAAIVATRPSVRRPSCFPFAARRRR